MFIMSGHCAATKRVAPQVRLRRTELLPSPLRGASAAGGAHGAADAPVAEEVELEVFPAPAFTGITLLSATLVSERAPSFLSQVATLYLGAGVDPDAAITRSPCSHSVRALSVVECITFDASAAHPARPRARRALLRGSGGPDGPASPPPPAPRAAQLGASGGGEPAAGPGDTQRHPPPLPPGADGGRAAGPLQVRLSTKASPLLSVPSPALVSALKDGPKLQGRDLMECVQRAHALAPHFPEAP